MNKNIIIFIISILVIGFALLFIYNKESTSQTSAAEKPVRTKEECKFNINICERLKTANTIVIGAGYGSKEYDRLEKNHGKYFGVGNDGDINPKIIQEQIFGDVANNYKEIIDNIKKYRTDTRGKFKNARIDNSVINYFEKSIPHPEHGYGPDGKPNGNKIFVLDENAAGIKILKDVLDENGTIYFSVDTKERLKDVKYWNTFKKYLNLQNINYKIIKDM